jgi:uncharacterized protein
MEHRIPSLHLLPTVLAPFILVVGLILTVLQGHPSFAAGARKSETAAAVKPSIKCDKAPTGIDRLICLEPSLSSLDAALGPAVREHQDRAAQATDRDARATEQRLWLDRREIACPAAA